MALYSHWTPDPAPLLSTSIPRVAPVHNSALSNPISGPSSGETANCATHCSSVHGCNCSRSHCFHISMFCCHGRGGMETWGLGPGPYIFNRSLAPAGLKCNHASYSYCPCLPLFFSTTSITQRDMHVTVVGLHSGGWGPEGWLGVSKCSQRQEKQSFFSAMLFVGVRGSSKCLQTAIITYYRTTMQRASVHCYNRPE